MTKSRIVAVVAGALALAGAALYFQSPDAPSAASLHATSAGELAARVDGLAARMRESPQDAAGWAMLGRSYAALGRFEDSAAAFERAAELAPADAQLLADYADVAAVTQGNKFQGKPEALLARALAAQPANAKALWLSGTALFQKADYAGAAREWRRLLAAVPPDSPTARSARRSIGEAERRAAARN